MSNNPLEALILWKDKALFELYQADLEDLPWWKRPLVHVLRILVAILRDMGDGQLNMRAMSLVYTTLLSLVPLLAISFSVLKGFGAHNQIEPALLNVLEPLGNERFEITEKVIGFVDNIKVGVLGTFGLGVLLYTVISLMTKIERAFNYTWNVTTARRFTARFSDYLSVLLIGPFLIFVSVGLTASIRNAGFLENVTGLSLLGGVFEYIASTVPLILMTCAFAFIYTFMPNTRVRLVPALTGGAVTMVMWKLLGFLFATVVASSASYSAIYSAFATLIIFMIWLYFGWLVLLIGASVAYYVQHPSNCTVSRQRFQMGNEMREHLSLSILGRVAMSYYQDDKTSWTVSRLAESLKLPIRIIEDSVETLQHQNLLAEQRDYPYALIPASPFDELKMVDALKFIRAADVERSFVSSRAKSELKTQDIMAQIDDALAKQFGNMTVKDWAVKNERKVKKRKAPKK